MDTITQPLSSERTTTTTTANTMRAILQSGYGTTNVLRAGTAQRPKPGPGEVLVQVRAAGLDRGTWHLMTGRPYVGSSRVDLQACKLEYSIVSPK